MNLTKMARRQLATIDYLERVREVIPKARDQELRYIFSQLKDPDYIWEYAMLAYEDRDSVDNRLALRMAAFFWSAGIRPADGLLSEDVAEFIDKVAFLLVAHRKMLKWELPTSANRMWLRSTREASITNHVLDDPQLSQSEHIDEAVDYLREVDTAIYCARNEQNYHFVPKLAAYLNAFCLLPEDIGSSAAALARWNHRQKVDTAKECFSPCRPIEYDGKIVTRPNIIYRNIYSVLTSLNEGVTLAEAGITADELRAAKATLDEWLPEAISDPYAHGVNPKDIISFNEQVMPMFTEVLNRVAPTTP